MAQYHDALPSQKTWIHELAQAEIHPDAEKLFQLGRSFDPQQLVEESTIDFLTEMRDCFTEYTRTFNAYAEAGQKFPEVKIYSVAQTAADYLIFRNQIKLMICNSSHGVIQLSFVQHVPGSIAVDGNQEQAMQEASELIAQVGPFRDVTWTFQGQKVDPEQVAKFYFSEFVRASRDHKKSKTDQKVLLEQIKTLLEQKGFDLK